MKNFTSVFKVFFMVVFVWLFATSPSYAADDKNHPKLPLVLYDFAEKYGEPYLMLYFHLRDVSWGGANEPRVENSI